MGEEGRPEAKPVAGEVGLVATEALVETAKVGVQEAVEMGAEVGLEERGEVEMKPLAGVVL
jgi:hypothetical protein